MLSEIQFIWKNKIHRLRINLSYMEPGSMEYKLTEKEINTLSKKMSQFENYERQKIKKRGE